MKASIRPKVFVLMATCNGVRFLDEQLDSILEQRDVEVELIASDDLSTDGTAPLLDTRAAADSRVTRLRSPEARLGAAGNFIRLLREVDLRGCDYVALSDQDDIWSPGRLSKAVARIAESGASGYSSDVLAFWPDGREQALGKGHAPTALDYLFEPAGPGCSYVLSKALALAIQSELSREPARFGRVRYHDWLFYAMARARGFAWVIDDEPSLRYRQHALNDTGANRGWRAKVQRIQQLRAGIFRDRVLLIADLVHPSSPPGALASHVVMKLRRLSIADRAWLAWHVGHLRRNPKDRLALAVLLLSGTLN